MAGTAVYGVRKIQPNKMSTGSTTKPKYRDLRGESWIYVGILYAYYAELTGRNECFFDLTCYTCDYVAISIKDYQLHLILQHLKSDCNEWGLVSCPHCNDNFGSSLSYRKHLDIVYPNTPNLSYCVFCPFTAHTPEGDSSEKLADGHVMNIHLKRFYNIGKGDSVGLLMRYILKDCIAIQTAVRAKRESVMRTKNNFRICKSVEGHNEILVHPPIFTSTPKKVRPAARGMKETARATTL